VCERILFDRPGFVGFLSDADSLVQVVAHPRTSLGERRHALHTLKGNCALSGLPAFARHCHALEESLAEDDGAFDGALVDALTARWRSLHTKIVRLFGDGHASRIELSEPEYARITRAVIEGATRRDILFALEELKLESVEPRLNRLADQARAVARKLDKGGLEVVVDSNGLRLNRPDLAPLWSALVHTIRNAVDHGVESTAERLAAGKRPTGTVALRTRRDAGSFVIEVSDDGRGIPWERIRLRACQVGLPAATRDDLLEALFTDGLSTRDQTTELSGRGVGMGALRAICRQLDGTIRVESEPGRGTRIEVRIPQVFAPRLRVSSRPHSPLPPLHSLTPMDRASIQARAS
jgi:two-component system chemotaxis sensor kinase CheA